MGKEITVTIETTTNDISIKDIKKYSNKAKNILNGKASSRRKKSSNIQITNESVIVKKYATR